MWSSWALGVPFGMGASIGGLSIVAGLYAEAVPFVLMAGYSLGAMIFSTRGAR